MTKNSLQLDAKLTLQARRRNLLQSWHTGQHDEQELLDERGGDWFELANDQRIAGILERVGEREVAELREISAALARIEAGTWGTCQDCGEAIPTGRLRVLPEARKCTDCASAHTEPRSLVPAEPEDHRQVNDVADAIRGYEPGAWGQCKRCGEPLELPDTSFCKECTSLVEAGLGETRQTP